MVRWGQIAYSKQGAEAARLSYRPDLYRQALAGLGVAMPGASAKIEGALTERTHLPAARGELVLGRDGFFDGVIFDPDRLEDYIAGSAIKCGNAQDLIAVVLNDAALHLTH